MSCDIPSRQNDAYALKLLQARAATWDAASRWQVLQILATVIAPSLSSLAAIMLPDLRPYAVGLAATVLVADALIIDPKYREGTLQSAKIGEMLDVYLFRLPWNYVAAGDQPSPEEIGHATAKWNGDLSNLLDWYPTQVVAAPVEVARILCQRSMVWFDSELRRGFGGRLAFFGAFTFGALTLFGITQGLTVSEWILSVLAPAAPVAVWLIRERKRQIDAITLNRRIARAAEDLLKDFQAARADEHEMLRRCRDLQTGILARRTTNSRIPNWVYRRMRPRLQLLMCEGAAKWVADLGYGRSLDDPPTPSPASPQ